MGFDDGLTRYADGAFHIVRPRPRVCQRERSGRSIATAPAGSGSPPRTGGGLVQCGPAREAARPTFVAYTTAHGLASDNSEMIVEDADGRRCTSVARTDSTDSIPPPSGVCRHFSTADGLATGHLPGCFPRPRGGAVVRHERWPLAARARRSRDADAAAARTLITGMRVARRFTSCLGGRRA